jgi:hypothetical protein
VKGFSSQERADSFAWAGHGDVRLVVQVRAGATLALHTHSSGHKGRNKTKNTNKNKEFEVSGTTPATADNPSLQVCCFLSQLLTLTPSTRSYPASLRALLLDPPPLPSRSNNPSNAATEAS